MKQSINEILTKAISDVGCWTWWDEVDGDYMVEFGGVQLFDESKRGKNARSSSLAVCFYDNAFIVFLDNEDSEWYNALHNDEMNPFTLDPDGFSLNDKEYAVSLLSKFSNRRGPFCSREESVEAILNANELLSATCGEYGFIIGGNNRIISGRSGDLSDDDIERLSSKWWEYWKDYWKKRNTKDAYKQDYACEVTIPIE